MKEKYIFTEFMAKLHWDIVVQKDFNQNPSPVKLS